MGSPLRRLASQTILYGVTYFGGRLLNFLLTPFYTRYFSQQEDYGALTFIYAGITFGIILYTYGLETGFFFFSNKEEEHATAKAASTAHLSIVTSSTIFSILLLLFAPAVASLLPSVSGNADFIRYAAVILWLDALVAIPFALMRKQDQANRFAGLKLLNIILNIGFNLFFLLGLPALGFGRGGGSLALHYIFISNIIASAVTLALAHESMRSISWHFSADYWKALIRYSWPLLLLGLAGMVNETLDRILLAYRLPGTSAERLAIAGVYAACYKISIFMTLAVASFRYAAEPFFFKELRAAAGKHLYAKGLTYFIFITSLIFLVVSLALPLVIKIIGENYRSGAAIVPVLLYANLLLGIYYYLSQWYKQTSNNLYGAYITIGGAVLTLLINYIFIPRYGFYASAYATLITYLVMAVVSYFWGQRVWPVPFNQLKLLLYLLLPLICFRAVHLIEYGILYTIASIIAVTGVVGLFLYLEKPLAILKHYGNRS